MTQEVRPARHGLPWSTSEDKALLKYLSRDVSIEEIAKIHNRSISGITCRIKLLTGKDVEIGGPIHEKERGMPINVTINLKEKEMENLQVPFIETVTLIQGRDARDFTVDEIIRLIKTREDRITKLTDIKRKPKMIQREIETTEQELLQLIDFLDKLEPNNGAKS